jgi:glycosyltransferase involved in cell wall biosynthesis
MAIMESETITGLQPIQLRTLPAEPLVSILVSNYNYGHFIAETIQSALTQTYTNIELIICDDGSTDNSVEVIEEFERKDARLRLIRKQNGGQGSGFNAAFAASRGDIIALLDSDDLFLSHKVERIVANFQEHPDAGFGVHRVIRISVDHRRQGVWPMSAPLPAGWYGTTLLEDGGVLPYMPPTSGLSLRRDVAERIFPLPLDEIMVKCPDQYVTRVAPLLTNVTNTGEALSEYRLHGDNNYGPDKVTAASFKRELDYCEALWIAQKRFLGTIDPVLAEGFKPLDEHPFILQVKYLHARLARDPNVRGYFDRYMEVMKLPGARHILFWKLSIYMPLPLFDFAINLLIRQSRLKQIVARLKRMT